MPASSGFEVEVVTWWGKGTDEPKVISGGFTDAAPGDHSDYRAAYFVFTRWIGDHCASWWAAARPSVLGLYLEVSDYYRTGRLVRLNGDEVTARARRRPEDLFADARDRDLARDDLTALLKRAATRHAIPAPPTLPETGEMKARIDATAAEHRQALREEDDWLHRDLDPLSDGEW